MEKVEKPWGYYKTLVSSEKYIVKEITIFPQRRISLQKHYLREEIWYAIEGEGVATINEREGILFNSQFCDFLFIDRGNLHRIKNVSNSENLVFIEIQSGQKLDENDIIRFRDDFGRTLEVQWKDF